MSTLALLTTLLLVMVALLTAGGLAYLVHREPALTQPITVALMGLALLGTVITAIAAR